MKLYDFPLAPNPRKLRVYLAEKGIEIPKVMVDLTKGEQNTPEFLARNPMGGLPVLELDDALREKVKRRIRANTTPRHVPAVIAQVADIPRTKSGKIVELAVRDVVAGRAVKNREALANPEALELFRDRVELAT